MTQIVERPLPFAVVALVLLIATVTDLRERRVPLWLTASGIALGLVWGAISGGPDGLRESGIGLLAGLLPLAPFVLIGLWREDKGMGGGDAVLLGVVGTWLGWRLVLSVMWWGAMVGGVLALILLVWRRTLKQAFPYVPALAIGAVIAVAVQVWWG
jgi:prepilin peptidase CpaA